MAHTKDVLPARSLEKGSTGLKLRGRSWAGGSGPVLLALLPPLLAAGLQTLFWDQIRPFIWFLFYPAVFLSAWIAGLRGAVPAALLAAFFAVYGFVPPYWSFPKQNTNHLYSVVLFLLMGGLFGYVQKRLAAAKQEAQEALSATRRAHRELEGLYAKAREMDELKTRFFSNVSHELRTPLTLILGPLGQRLADPGLDSGLREDLDRMARNARLLLGQVNDLLDVAKLEAGRMEFRPAPVDLAQLLRLECSRFENLARERGLDFGLEAPDRLPTRLDPEMLRRILANLLSNAFKFTPVQGRIRAEAVREGPMVRLEVRDSGPGIPVEHRDAVFDRFKQLDAGSDRSHGGTGLGLAIVKEFVALHGGTIAVETAAEGGACFRILLPSEDLEDVPVASLDALPEPVVAELLALSAAPAAPVPGAATVLVVEDNPDMNAFLAGILGRQFGVRCAFSGAEGLAAALADPPDLILSDIMMPGMSGDRLVAELRRHTELEAVPVVLLTAKADDALRVKMLRGGVADYICKPFSTDELLARVSGLLVGRRRQQALLQSQEARFQATFEQAAVGIALVAQDGGWIAANQRLCDMLGYRREELLQVPVAELTHPQDRDRTRTLAQELMDGSRATCSQAKRYLRKDGAPLWVQVTASLVQDGEGRPSYFSAIVEDIDERKRTEAALGASEARFRGLFEGILEGVAYCRMEYVEGRPVDWRYLQVNPAFATLTGLQGVTGRLVSDLIPGIREAHPELFEIYGRVAAGGAPERFEIQFRPLGIWLAISVYPGEPGQFIAVIDNISQRKRTEQAIRESEERFRQVSESADEWIWEVDAEGLYTYASPAVERILGLRAEEVVGRLYFYDLFEPRSRERIKAQAFEAFARREPLRNLPNTNLDREGREVLLETTGFPILGPDGELLGYRGVDRDITERSTAAEILRASEERFQAVFLASPIAILITQPQDGRILDANPAFHKLFGYAPADLRERTTLQLGLWHSVETRLEVLDRIQREHRLRDFEALFRSRSGEVMTLQLSAELVSLGAEDVVLSLFQDFRTRVKTEEERRQLERELGHLQRMESIGRLAGGVSHDMNNVLAAIMAVASLMKIVHKGSPEVLKNADTILQAGMRGRDLVKGLMDFARKDLQNAVALDLNDLVRQEADLLERTTLKKIGIHLALAEPLPEVLGERSALANVLMNLCVNACDAMPKGGRLSLATRTLADGGVELAVEDSGEGMPAEVVARAMEPFFTTKPAGMGTGLGLSIVYGTVKAHGGSVEIKSQPGQGTRVALTFPPLDRPTTAPVTAGRPAPFPELRTLRLLIVDDDELVRASLPPMLESMGHQVQVSSSGLDALRRLGSGLEADLVILDMNMPGLDGLETLSRLRILRPDMPVVVATGFHDPAARDQLARFPRLSLLTKPFSAEELGHTMAALLG